MTALSFDAPIHGHITALIQRAANFHMSIDTSGFQPAFGLTVPTAGQVQLFNSTLNAFQALAPGTGISLTTSSDGKTATIATTGLQSTLSVSSPTQLDWLYAEHQRIPREHIRRVVGTQANPILRTGINSLSIDER